MSLSRYLPLSPFFFAHSHTETPTTPTTPTTTPHHPSQRRRLNLGPPESPSLCASQPFRVSSIALAPVELRQATLSLPIYPSLSLPISPAIGAPRFPFPHPLCQFFSLPTCAPVCHPSIPLERYRTLQQPGPPRRPKKGPGLDPTLDLSGLPALICLFRSCCVLRALLLKKSSGLTQFRRRPSVGDRCSTHCRPRTGIG